MAVVERYSCFPKTQSGPGVVSGWDALYAVNALHLFSSMNGKLNI